MKSDYLYRLLIQYCLNSKLNYWFKTKKKVIIKIKNFFFLFFLEYEVNNFDGQLNKLKIYINRHFVITV